MQEADPTDGIKARIDALLIAWKYADNTEKRLITARIDALSISLQYEQNA